MENEQKKKKKRKNVQETTGYEPNEKKRQKVETKREGAIREVEEEFAKKKIISEVLLECTPFDDLVFTHIWDYSGCNVNFTFAGYYSLTSEEKLISLLLTPKGSLIATMSHKEVKSGYNRRTFWKVPHHEQQDTRKKKRRETTFKNDFQLIDLNHQLNPDVNYQVRIDSANEVYLVVTTFSLDNQNNYLLVENDVKKEKNVKYPFFCAMLNHCCYYRWTRTHPGKLECPHLIRDQEGQSVVTSTCSSDGLMMVALARGLNNLWKIMWWSREAVNQDFYPFSQNDVSELFQKNNFPQNNINLDYDSYFRYSNDDPYVIITIKEKIQRTNGEPHILALLIFNLKTRQGTLRPFHFYPPSHYEKPESPCLCLGQFSSRHIQVLFALMDEEKAAIKHQSRLYLWSLVTSYHVEPITNNAV